MSYAVQKDGPILFTKICSHADIEIWMASIPWFNWKKNQIDLIGYLDKINLWPLLKGFLNALGQSNISIELTINPMKASVFVIVAIAF